MKVLASSCVASLLCVCIIVVSVQSEVIVLNIGKYEFESSTPNGIGGYGRVYRARKIEGSSTSPAHIAIKISFTDVVPNQFKPFEYEKNNYVKLGLEYDPEHSSKHPKGFPVFYQYGIHDSKEYIAIEFIGEDISKRKKPFSLKDSLILQEQLLERLKYIHSRGLAYGDIRPENLAFINGVLYIYDFGTTIPFMEDETNLSLYYKGGTGTDMYMSLRAHKNQDATLYPRDDIEAASLLSSENVTHAKLPWFKEMARIFMLQKKLEAPIWELFPHCLPALVFFAEYVRSLPPYAKIDYDFLQNIINEAKLSHDIPLNAKADENEVNTTPKGHNGEQPQKPTSHSVSATAPPLASSSSSSSEIDDQVHPLAFSSASSKASSIYNPFDDEEIKNAEYGGPATEILLPPIVDVQQYKRKHYGPCSLQKDSHEKDFGNVAEIYAKGIKYALRDEDLVPNDKYKPIQAYEVNRLGYTFCIKVRRRDGTRDLPIVLQNEKIYHQIVENKMKSKIIRREHLPFGVPIPVTRGYQAQRDYIITRLPEGEPLSAKKNFSNKMIIQMGLEALEIFEFFHEQLGMVLVHISKESFWVSRFGRQRRIVWRGVDGSQSFHLTVVRANFDKSDPYQSKRCMAIGAHEGKDYIPAYDVESLGWMMYLLLSLQNKPDSPSESPPDDLLRIKKDVLAACEKTTNVLLAFIKYANGLNGMDPIDYEFLKDLLRSHPDHDPNFNWVKEEIAATNANQGLKYHFNNLKNNLKSALNSNRASGKGSTLRAFSSMHLCFDQYDIKEQTSL